MGNRMSCSTIIAIGISLFFIVYLIRSYSTQDKLAAEFAKEREDETREKQKRNDAYKKLYNFSIDSLMPLITTRKIGKKQNVLTFPIIVFRQWEDKVYFDDDFNRQVPRSLTSFAFDSIKTIILLKRDVIKVGNYQNNKTGAYQHQVTIVFINKATMSEVKSDMLKGSFPPTSVSYKRSAPDGQYGLEISNEEILKTINVELSKNE